MVDDDRSLRDALRRALSLEGYEIDLAEGGQQALTRIAAAKPDAVVLDVGMPGMDGLEVCRRLRSAGNRVPVLILTARESVEDRIDGLDAGANDYLAKPFDVGELKARLRALLRRAGEGGAAEELRFKELRLDVNRHGVVVEEAFAELTRTEYQLLELLMRNLPHRQAGGRDPWRGRRGGQRTRRRGARARELRPAARPGRGPLHRGLFGTGLRISFQGRARPRRPRALSR